MNGSTPMQPMVADLILHNGKIATQDHSRSFVRAVAIKNGRFIAVGDSKTVLEHSGPKTEIINLRGRTVVPGLNDSHLHLIRGGLSYNIEVHWTNVPTLAQALQMLKEQARRTPPGQWIRVVGGWSEFQFAERRMPTLAEINAVAPDVPVFVMHLYNRALLNRAAVRALGFSKYTPPPHQGVIERDKNGKPSGLLLAAPNPQILYAALAAAPKLSPEHQYNSTRQFMRELNRLGVTSVVDPDGGFHYYPDDYQVIREMHRRGEMSVRIAYHLSAQNNKGEFAEFKQWIDEIKPSEGDDMLRCNGAGEILTFSACDFENFLQPRPNLAPQMEAELAAVIKLLVQNRWPFRMHATYDESISRFLGVLEIVNREVPLKNVRWFFDHCETVSDANLDRIKALGGGISIQHRMAFQGEYFIDRFGAETARRTPPMRRMLERGITVGSGTDGTRIASYNPFLSLYWQISGKTLGGTQLYSQENRLDRMEALRLFTVGSAALSGEQAVKGAIQPGQLADLAVLSDDYFLIPEEQIKKLESVLTIVGGKVVHASNEFSQYAPPSLQVLPNWSTNAPNQTERNFSLPSRQAVAYSKHHTPLVSPARVRMSAQHAQ